MFKIWYFRFPGAVPSDDVPNLIKLLLSKDPNSTIRSQVALNGGYKECTAEQKRAKNYNCSEDFVLDEENMICYKVLNIVANFSFGEELCNEESGSSGSLYFDNEKELRGFYNLLTTGK